MSDLEDPRETIVTTAVNFLQNPKVRDSPLSAKKAFLEKKGLTKSEVDIAIERSGVLENADHSSNGVQPYQSPSMAEHGQMYNHHMVPVNSTWSKVRDFTALTIVVGGVGVAVYRFYQHVVRPYMFGVQQKSIENQVLEIQEEITQTLVKVQESLQAIQDRLKQQEDRLQQLSIQAGAKKTEETLGRLQDSQLVTDLKSDVTSIKGLLLNRRQFPPTPSTTPVLPSWQRSKPSPVTPGSTGDTEDSLPNTVDSVSECSDQLAGSDSLAARQSGESEETVNGHTDTSGSELVMANNNEHSDYDTSMNRDVDEDDELGPANQIIDDQSVNSLPSSVAMGSTNGVLAEDDTTLEVVS